MTPRSFAPSTHRATLLGTSSGYCSSRSRVNISSLLARLRQEESSAFYARTQYFHPDVTHNASKFKGALFPDQNKSADVSRLLENIRKHIAWISSREQTNSQPRYSLPGDIPPRLKIRKLSVDLEELESTHVHLQDLLGILQANADTLLLEEVKSELNALHSRSEALMTASLLSEPLDYHDAYIEIRAGSGGTEACDWAAMLSRMYVNWAHSRDFVADIVDQSTAEVTGVKSTTLLVKGPYAFGYAQFESGVHRLVRISPFDRGGNRHTSFASVQVSPQTDETHSETTDLDPSELHITTMRSQGAGGQHVNKTESAIRIVHLPTKITVTCQKERSQHRNKSIAMALLKAKLFNLQRQKQALNKSKLHMELPENSWGSQIRSYVLNPYQLVKDTRTGYEQRDARCILDGGLQEFMRAGLYHFRQHH